MAEEKPVNEEKEKSIKEQVREAIKEENEKKKRKNWKGRVQGVFDNSNSRAILCRHFNDGRTIFPTYGTCIYHFYYWPYFIF